MASLRLKRTSLEVKLPTRSFGNAVGFDLYAFALNDRNQPHRIQIPPNNTRAVRTGLLIEPPSGHVTLVCSRSGLAKEHAIFVTNAPGIIDPDYRGEIIVLLHNGGLFAHYIQHGDRIAQLIVLPFPEIELQEVEELSQTERGAQGFGSTGR